MFVGCPGHFGVAASQSARVTAAWLPHPSPSLRGGVIAVTVAAVASLPGPSPLVLTCSVAVGGVRSSVGGLQRTGASVDDPCCDHPQARDCRPRRRPRRAGAGGGRV